MTYPNIRKKHANWDVYGVSEMYRSIAAVQREARLIAMVSSQKHTELQTSNPPENLMRTKEPWAPENDMIQFVSGAP